MRNYLLPEKGTYYKANLHCHFCSKEYDFNEEQLVALLEEAK